MLFTITGPEIGQSQLCEPILRALPGWFGIESANQQYLHDIENLPTFIAWNNNSPVGFITLKQHFPESAEIHVMGVKPANHRQGIGAQLLQAAEVYLRAQGTTYLQVKTLSPAHPDPGYAKTRQYYQAMGFSFLEEFPLLWGEENPCLMLVKRL